NYAAKWAKPVGKKSNSTLTGNGKSIECWKYIGRRSPARNRLHQACELQHSRLNADTSETLEGVAPAPPRAPRNVASRRFAAAEDCRPPKFRVVEVLDLLDLPIFKLEGCRAAEDRGDDSDGAFVGNQ